ncbi:MAG: GNAT family N-acetyltransferase [Clostridia bacterium]|nr:GNAT family N-acetyltransferase [Clostridia bacterium]
MKIRYATLNDLNAIADLEKACFPPLEAAPIESFKKRLNVFPNHFWLMYEGNMLVSCVNGFATNEEILTDEMFENAGMHDENGAWQMIFGVLTHPDHRMKGYATKLLMRAIDDAKAQKRKGVILTCKPALIPFYARLGFIDEGVSPSEHGGALWHQMRIPF